MTRFWRRSLAAVALIAALWAAAVWLSGGFAFVLGTTSFSSRTPVPALIIAALALTARAVASGLERTRADLADLIGVLRPAPLAGLLAVSVTAVALAHNSWTAGGSDAYSYVTQADLWLQGDLRIPVPIAEVVPWPNGLATFTPFGYTAAPDRHGIVPMTGAGLPLMMAVMKVVFGHCAIFWVVPLCAGLLVWTTFAIGRRVGGEMSGLAAAWLLASSPVAMTMARVPMSDVPATAFWALALLFVFGESMAAAVCGGLAAGAAVLVRPNLVALAAVPGAWIFWRFRRVGPRNAVVRLLGFGAGLLPAGLFVSWVNTNLYGGPLASGYGDASALFSLSYVQTNLERYGRWLLETQTPLALMGMLILVIPSTRVWPTIEARRAALLLAFFTLGVWAAYLAYVPFNAWWFLRFLLPCWPAICLGTASLIVNPLEARGALSRAAAVLVVFALGLNGIRIALNHDVFPDDEGERRYATVAGLVENMTEPSAIILTSEHAGPIRYYAGRLTLRSDLLDEAWLDRAVNWLKDAGRHPYFLLEDWELPSFRKRFAGTNVLGRLELSPLLAYESYQGPGTVYLFDPMQPTARTLEPLPIRDRRPHCVAPARQPSYSLH